MKYCDFCTTPNPVRVYRDKKGALVLRAFVESGPELFDPQTYSGEWAACSNCGNLIDSGRWSTLLTQAVALCPFTEQDALDLYAQMIGTVYKALEESGMERIR